MIIRELKFSRFSYEPEKKELFIQNKKSGESVKLNKIYMYSLMRFIVSLSAKGFGRSLIKKR